jgi:hypothetical protein
MIREQYHELLRSFCTVSGLDSQKLIEDGLLTVGGTDMLLFYDEKASPGLLKVRLDFGECKPEIEGRLMRTLMIANYVWGLGGALVFSAHPDFGNVILTFATPVTPHMTGQMLMDDLLRCAQEARQCWDAVQNMLRDLKNDPAMMGMMGV